MFYESKTKVVLIKKCCLMIEKMMFLMSLCFTLKNIVALGEMSGSANL